MVKDSLNLSKVRGFDWDTGNLEHLKKHNVNYKECEELFLNKPFIMNEDTIHSQTEKRIRAYGQSNKKRLIVMIFTTREDKIRVISARDQNKKERREFKIRGGEKL